MKLFALICNKYTKYKTDMSNPQKYYPLKDMIKEWFSIGKKKFGWLYN